MSVQFDNQNAQKDSNRESRGSLCTTKLANTTVVPTATKLMQSHDPQTIQKQAPLTRYCLHFISDCYPQSGLKVSLPYDIIYTSSAWGSVYTTPLSITHRTELLFTRESFIARCNESIVYFFINCAFCTAYQMNGGLLESIMKFRIDLMQGTTVYMISDWFHALFTMS